MLEAREVAPTVGPYRLEARIGGAGGAEVWIARRTDERGLGAALKLVRAGDEGPFATFREEIRAAQTLAHPGLVPVFDFGDSEHGFFIASELIDGPSLGALIERLASLKTPLPPAVIGYIGMRTSEALGYAMSHASIDGLSIRLVHRHLSPSNLLLDLVGHVRVADLGVAASIANPSPISGRMVRGSPAYLSPEQLRDEPIDQRADIFSLGVVLYQCATFQLPFQGSDAKQIMHAVLHHEPKPIGDLVPGFPVPLAQVIMRCLNKDPLLRPAGTGELRSALIDATSSIGGTADAPMVLGRLIASTFPRGDYPQAAARRNSKVDHFEAPTKLIESEPTVETTANTEKGRSASAGAPIYPKTAVTTEILPTNIPAAPLPPPSIKETNGTNGSSAAPRREIVEKASPRSDPAIPAITVSPVITSVPPLNADALPSLKTEPAPPPAPRSVTRGPSGPSVPIIQQPPPGDGVLQQLSDLLEDPRRGKLIAFGFGLVIVALLLALVLNRTSSDYDEELRRLYEAQDYVAAEAYFVEHTGRFQSPEAAFELASDARMRKLGLPFEALAHGAMHNDKAIEKKIEPELKQLEPDLQPLGETMVLAQGAGPIAHDITAPAEIPVPPAKNKADKKARARAIKIEQFGQRMVQEGNRPAAEESFARCLEVREHPGCHLRLALLLLERGDRKQAVDHLDRYSLLYPEDPQSDQIKRLILALKPADL